MIIILSIARNFIHPIHFKNEKISIPVFHLQLDNDRNCSSGIPENN